MAQTRTAKGTAASKTSGTTSTITSVSMIGGDSLEVAVAWDITEAANPTITYGGREIKEFVVGETIGAKWRMRKYFDIINNTRTADLVTTWPASVTTRVMTASAFHQGGKTLYDDTGENLASTISVCGAFAPIKHITTIASAHHVSNGPVGDATGTSSTGMTLGQRIGTSGDADNTNLTIQERYKIVVASTIAAGSFVIGDDYQIKTVGTTDFTAIGAASNTVGVQFTATGVGSGTGDAYHLEDVRSRLTGLTSRDHMGAIAFYSPKQTFTITKMRQHHRNMNHNPDWVFVEVEDESGAGFEFPIDPDLFDDWSDQVVSDYVAKMASIWVTNLIDSKLSYSADTARDTRMATFVNDQVIL